VVFARRQSPDWILFTGRQYLPSGEEIIVWDNRIVRH